MHLNNKYEYEEILSSRCSILPDKTPGRGVIKEDGKLFEIQVLNFFSSDLYDSENSCMQNLIKNSKKSVNNVTYKLDDTSIVDIRSILNPNYMTIPLGLYKKEFKTIILPLKQLTMFSIYMDSHVYEKNVISYFYEIFEFYKINSIFFKKEHSIIDTISLKYKENISVIECTDENLDRMNMELLSSSVDKKYNSINFIDLIKKQVSIAVEYCENNKLDITQKKSQDALYKYMRCNTKPLFIVFEDFLEVCLKLNNNSPALNKVFKEIVYLSGSNVIINHLYNIYFIGFFYRDININIEEINTNKSLYNVIPFYNLVLFVGDNLEHNNICKIQNSSIRNQKQNQNECVLKYRNNFYYIQPYFSIPLDETDNEDKSIFDF